MKRMSPNVLYVGDIVPGGLVTSIFGIEYDNVEVWARVVAVHPALMLEEVAS